ncbi:hypothetical protein ADUPG1_013576, partial [Aduncisulcus paluster]
MSLKKSHQRKDSTSISELISKSDDEWHFPLFSIYATFTSSKRVFCITFPIIQEKFDEIGKQCLFSSVQTSFYHQQNLSCIPLVKDIILPVDTLLSDKENHLYAYTTDYSANIASTYIPAHTFSPFYIAVILYNIIDTIFILHQHAIAHGGINPQIFHIEEEHPTQASPQLQSGQSLTSMILKHSAKTLKKAVMYRDRKDHKNVPFPHVYVGLLGLEEELYKAVRLLSDTSDAQSSEDILPSSSSSSLPNLLLKDRYDLGSTLVSFFAPIGTPFAHITSLRSSMTGMDAMAKLISPVMATALSPSFVTTVGECVEILWTGDRNAIEQARELLGWSEEVQKAWDWWACEDSVVSKTWKRPTLDEIGGKLGKKQVHELKKKKLLEVEATILKRRQERAHQRECERKRKEKEQREREVSTERKLAERKKARELRKLKEEKLKTWRVTHPSCSIKGTKQHSSLSTTQRKGAEDFDVFEYNKKRRLELLMSKDEESLAIPQPSRFFTSSPLSPIKRKPKPIILPPSSSSSSTFSSCLKIESKGQPYHNTDIDFHDGESRSDNPHYSSSSCSLVSSSFTQALEPLLERDERDDEELEAEREREEMKKDSLDESESPFITPPSLSSFFSISILHDSSGYPYDGQKKQEQRQVQGTKLLTDIFHGSQEYPSPLKSDPITTSLLRSLHSCGLKYYAKLVIGALKKLE